MNENNRKKREWVKTAAIIFLAIMLVLTFFSNTIMNYSLPEVATQYVQSGTITAKIRGTGVIESGDPYEMEINETRKVESVAVRVGDEVQKGDTLIYFEEGESEELEAAKEALKEANEEYMEAILTDSISAEDISAAGQNISASTYRKQITSYQTAIKAAKEKIEPLQEKADALNEQIQSYNDQIEYEQTADSLAEERVPVMEAAEKKAEKAMKAAQEELKAAKEALEKLEQSLSSGDATQAQVNAAKKKVKEKQAAYDAAQEAYEKAKAARVAAEQAVEDRSASPAVINLKNAKAACEAQLAAYEKEIKKAEAEKDKLTEELTELLATIGNIRGLSDKLEGIEKARKLVKELEEKKMDLTLTAAISGKILEINATAGKNTSASEPIVVIQPEGKGYFMTFSVTNEQAKRLSVGDKADLVNAWRYDDVDVVLSSIKVDTTDPGQKKLLTFDISGDVVAGQTLNVSVGQKSANYDLIVPNSALREDSNGKFILIVESKPSPLGNRYVATRVDVEVLASDDTQSAISGALYGYEFVITTSTKPVEAGKLIRLAD